MDVVILLHEASLVGQSELNFWILLSFFVEL